MERQTLILTGPNSIFENPPDLALAIRRGMANYWQRPHQVLGYRTPAEVYQNGQDEKGVAGQEVGLPSDLVKPSVGA